MNIFSMMILVDASEWIKIPVSNKVYFNFHSFKKYLWHIYSNHQKRHF